MSPILLFRGRIPAPGWITILIHAILGRAALGKPSTAIKILPMADTKAAFDVLTKAKELFDRTMPVTYEGKTYRLYFAGDLYRTYVKMGGHVDLSHFWKLFRRLSDYAVFPSTNPVYTIICRRDDVNKKVIWAAIGKKNNVGQDYEIVDKSAGGGIPGLSEDPSSTNKAIRSQTTSATRPKLGRQQRRPLISPGAAMGSLTWENPRSCQPIPASICDGSPGMDCSIKVVKRAKTMDTTGLGFRRTDTRSMYDDLSSSDDSPQCPPARFKSPLEPEKVAIPTKDSFGGLKTRIMHAFGNGCIIPVSSFSAAMCQSGAGAFDYRTAACNIPRHVHSSLTAFLRCCKEILSIRVLKSSYAVLETQAARGVNQKRLGSFKVPAADRRFPYYMEILCVNLLALKSAVVLGDFLELFELIYGTELESLVGCSPKDFLNNIGSPNIRVLNSKGVYSLVITPTSNPTYKYWMPCGTWDSVTRLEQRAVGGAELGDLQLATNVSLERMFSRHGGSRQADLMRIADLNLPKSVQEVSVDSIPDELVFTPLWKMLRHSVNFDDKRTFFL